MADGGCDDYKPLDNGWGRGDQPVINVSQQDARRYVRWLSRVTSKSYHLPTEMQWMYAARAGSKTKWWWGDEANPANGNFDASSSSSSKTTSRKITFRRKPLQVREFSANPWGMKNVHGNVAEWTLSCWSKHVDASLSSQQSIEWAKQNGADCGKRVVRGGGWDSYPEHSTLTARRRHSRDHRGDNLGFRVARAMSFTKWISHLVNERLTCLCDSLSATKL